MPESKLRDSIFDSLLEIVESIFTMTSCLVHIKIKEKSPQRGPSGGSNCRSPCSRVENK